MTALIRNLICFGLGFLLGTTLLSAGANSPLFDPGVIDGPLNCPPGYICVTREEYELHWNVCPIVPTLVSTPTDEPNGNPAPPPEPTDKPPEPTDVPTEETPEPTNTPTPTEEEDNDDNGDDDDDDHEEDDDHEDDDD